MFDASIENFWKKSFPALERFSIHPQDGWQSELQDIPYFVEPRLSLREDFSDLHSRIWLVSAPGAVGKSTLAKKIAYEINALYLDLAQAEPIGGNYIFGGLVKTGAQERLLNHTTTLFIDSLDEARLRVTTKAFEAFLNDLIVTSRQTPLPLVLFGRTGVIEDVALYLLENSITPVILDIEYFDLGGSLEFVKKYLYFLVENQDATDKYKDRIRGNIKSHGAELENCISRIIRSLGNVTTENKENFSGYAPVLQAISAFILSESLNFHSIGTETEKLLQNRILEKICRSVLLREQKKLKDQVVNAQPGLTDHDLYTIDEQIRCLAAYCDKKPVIPDSHSLHGEELESYTEAVQSLLPQHPFLAGSGRKPANAVFGAAILTHALKHGEAVESAYSEATVNPLLAEFYFYDSYVYKEEGERETRILPEHVAQIFNSITARAEQGRRIELSIEAGEDEEDADVTITSYSKNPEGMERIESFSIPHLGTVVFYDRISNVYIDAPLLTIEMRTRKKDVELVAPVDIAAAEIDIHCEALRAYPAHDDPEQRIVLEAVYPSLVSPGRVLAYDDVLAIALPNENEYPWSDVPCIGVREAADDSDDLQKALLSFSRLVRAFRSHSKGQKARFVDKIDHARMSKNFGKEIREQLLAGAVLERSGVMYILNTVELARVTGASYQDARLRNFKDQAVQYIRDIIRE